MADRYLGLSSQSWLSESRENHILPSGLKPNGSCPVMTWGIKIISNFMKLNEDKRCE